MQPQVRAVEEEYWTFQYQTGDSFRGTLRFWPPDGDGRYGTEAAAEAVARQCAERVDEERIIRVLHVTRRIEYGDPIEPES